jgi:hypothetical protein
MAQTGFTPILIYSSSTTTNAPAVGNLTNSTLGSELAINITDGKLFYKDNANAIQVIAWKVTPTTAGGTGLTSYTAGDLIYYASGTTFTKLGIGSAYQALQVNAGATAPSWQPSATSVLTTQGDLLYASGANTLARLAKDATATRYLSNTGTNNNPAWAQINLANGVTGTLPVANGGTGLTAGTSGGVLYYSAAGTLASSAALASTGVVLGGGAGAAPTASTSLKFDGTTLAATAASGGAALTLSTTNANASARNWAIVANNQSYGDFVLLQSDALGGDPLTAGTIRMYGTRNANQVIFGGGTSLAGAGSPLASVTGNADYIIGGNNTNAADPYGIFLKYTAAAPNGNSNRFFLFADSTTTRAYMQSNGGLANFSANDTNLSDRREKTNFAPAKDYLNVICAIPVQTFNYIDQNLADDPGITLGVVAQDVQTIAPELVAESNWGTKEEPKIRLSIYQTDLQYALMKCIQEIKQKLDDANVRIAALEATK